jgi:hypothetical protein
MTIWNSTCNPCFSTFDQIFFVFHGLKTVFFCYSLKLNFICYPNKCFTYDYSLWDGGDIRFCGQKQTFIDFVISPEICILGVLTGQYFNILNKLIVIVKYFIDVCKLKNQIPVWKDCVEYIKYCKKK